MGSSTVERVEVRRPVPVPAQAALWIDARMLFASGIGRYLRETLARIPEAFPRCVTVVCNAREQVDWISEHLPEAKVAVTGAKIYSAGEQLLGLRVPADATFWVPHYNVPVLGRARIVATVHDLAPLALPEVFRGRARQWAARLYFGSVRRRARRIIAVSQFTRQELEARGVAEAGRVAVVLNGVDAFWFRERPPTDRGLKLLFVGNLKPHKNLARLVEAVAIVREQVPVTLAVAGRVEGFRTGIGGTLVERLRSEPWIRLLTDATDEDLLGEYQEAAALVFPSLYEGFGLPMLEAMASGCPVVAARSSALSEIGGKARADGGLVDYFDPQNVQDMAQAILRSLEVPSGEVARIRAGGRQLAAAFTWDRTARETWRLLEETSRR